MQHRTVLAALAAVSLAVGLALPSSASPDRSDERAAEGSARARAALAEVREIFDGDRSDARRTHPQGRDATLALRDLARVRDELTGSDRRQANAFLARPTDGASDPYGDGYQASATPRRTCTATVCVHWVDTTSDRPAQVDADANSIPDFVDTTLATVTNVHGTYVAAGYRPPKADGTNGGDARTDIYLSDIGMQKGLYGYCTSDDPSETRWDLWAYCVLDNDYAEFPDHTPLENLQVTAAHEYFHAVQFGYDAYEDAWLMEATATWAEDELFDDVDDNVQYLSYGPLAKPRVPLDLSTNWHWYGDWIFFRYLTERFPTETGEMPNLVRDIWQRADAIPEAADEYSLQAVKNALADRGAPLGRIFAEFADANRRTSETYEEGAANGYPDAPAWRSETLTPGDPATAWNTVRLDHLTSATARFVPSKTMTADSWRLKVRVNLASRSRGSQAVVTVRMPGGGTDTSFISLDSAGDGSQSVVFDRDQVKAVELTVVNASDRTTCWVAGPPYSCQGSPLDDDLAEQVRGVASR
jgi:hypothetical protein